MMHAQLSLRAHTQHSHNKHVQVTRPSVSQNERTRRVPSTELLHQLQRLPRQPLTIVIGIQSAWHRHSQHHAAEAG